MLFVFSYWSESFSFVSLRDPIAVTPVVANYLNAGVYVRLFAAILTAMLDIKSTENCFN